MRKICLNNGYVALVDDKDFLKVAHLKWRAFVRPHTVYAVRTSGRRPGPRKTVYMHRVILNCKEGQCVDHRNRNGLDNRRANMRIATHLQNNRNAVGKCVNQTGLKGATFRKDIRKFEAKIRYGGERHILGYFKTAKEAHRAYCAAAAKHHGRFARFAA